MSSSNDPSGTTWDRLRKLTRPRRGRVIGGVCAAFGEATSVPAWMWRAGFCLALVLYGAGILVYIILMICIPVEPEASA